MKLARILPRHYKNFISYRYAHNAVPKVAPKIDTKSVEKTPDYEFKDSSKDQKIGVRPESDALPTEEEVVKKKPFAKRLFVGDFDTDVLTYPEVLDKERYEMLHDMLKPIESFFENKGKCVMCKM